MLDAPVLQSTTERIMIGLLEIAARKLYIVSMKRRKHDDELRSVDSLGDSNRLLYCNWTNIQFL